MCRRKILLYHCRHTKDLTIRCGDRQQWSSLLPKNCRSGFAPPEELRMTSNCTRCRLLLEKAKRDARKRLEEKAAKTATESAAREAHALAVTARADPEIETEVQRMRTVLAEMMVRKPASRHLGPGMGQLRVAGRDGNRPVGILEGCMMRKNVRMARLIVEASRGSPLDKVD